MTKKVGINGFGRIGKVVFRLLQTNPEVEVVGINDPMDIDTMVYLLKYDTVHGRFNGTVAAADGGILVNNHFVPVSAEHEPENIPWKLWGADYIIESSGLFKHRPMLEKHLKAGAKKIILSCPSEDHTIKSIVLGVNEDILTEEDTIISNASCTTNCLAPIMKIMDDEFGIETGFMNTVHPFTNNQRIIDAPHPDIRRSRAAASNIIPTTSTAIKALFEIMPQFKDRINGFATRVPVPDGSFVELCLNLSSDVNVSTINQLMKKSAEGKYLNLVEYTEDPIVSSDIVDNPHSAIFDARATKVIGTRFVQILAWYDNEYGYSSRIVDLLSKI
jgi:glyceraldehyde 3-phosphate dehydrogenase